MEGITSMDVPIDHGILELICSREHYLYVHP
jgi:hypothetical protein